MAELEKKYSDFQESECKDEQKIEIVDEKLCPTCEPNPNFKLEGEWWDIKKAYLHEEFCEYRVRVYETEAERELNADGDSYFESQKLEKIQEKILEVATLRILNEFDKPINDSTKEQVMAGCNIIDDYYGTNSRTLGTAYLVSVPAFNFDKILPNNDPNAEKDDSKNSSISGMEVILDGDTLYRKLLILRLTISSYGKFYSLAQSALNGDSFVIRQEADPIYRINYDNTATRVRNFMFDLSDVMQEKDYPRLGELGVFKAKRPERIKIVFAASERPYELDEIYVLPDAGCEIYEKLNVPLNSPLRHHSTKVVYHFLKNLDRVYNDIVAKETKPWLEWTLEHFYPGYIAEGGIDDLQNYGEGLECLLEDALGLDPGKIVDSLAKEIMSAFDSIDAEFAKQACREAERLAEGGPDRKQDPDVVQAAEEERRNKMLARYETEFKNKFYDDMVGQAKERRDKQIATAAMFETPNQSKELSAEYIKKTIPAPDKGNIFLILKKHYSDIPNFESPTYKFKNKEGKRVTGGTIDDQGSQAIQYEIKNETDLVSFAKDFAVTKYNNEEAGSFGDQIQNSPHYQEMKEAITEFYDTEIAFVSSLVDAVSGKIDWSLLEITSVIGVCGLNKTAGKALDCIANGISFNDFLNILIAKFFEYLQINYLNLLIEDLPADVRDDLNEAFAKEFGANVNLTDMFGIMLADGGNRKLKDMSTFASHAKRIFDLYKKYPLAQVLALGTEEEREYLLSKLSKTGEKEIRDLFAMYYWDETVVPGRAPKWEDKEIDRVHTAPLSAPGEEESARSIPVEKWVHKRLKYLMLKHKKSQPDYKNAWSRIGSAIGKPFADTYEFVKEPVDQIVARSELKKVEENVFEYDRQINTLNQQITDLIEEEGQIRSQLVNLRSTQVNETGAAQPDSQPDEFSFMGSSSVSAQIQSLEQRLAGVVSSKESLEQQETEAFAGRAENVEKIDPLDGEITTYPEYKANQLNQYEKAQKKFEETQFGVKVDIIFDIVFDWVVDYIMDSLSIDALFEYIKSYPAAEFAIDKLQQLLLPSCPGPPVIFPPLNDIFKSLSVDVCDPSMSMTMPAINIPSIDWRYKIQSQFSEIFREAMFKLVANIIESLVKKLLSFLEGSLCNAIEALGGLAAGALAGQDTTDAFYDALNEAFCNDGDSPQTSRKKAEELADALFNLNNLDPSINPAGGGKKVADIIGSVSTTNEVLGAIVAYGDEQNNQFCTTIANAVDILAPEMRALLGSPDQVAYFFKNLGSYLSPDDRERIRNLLDADIPNLPVSEAICLTNEELEDWNNLRNSLLQGHGLTPEEAASRVADLNRRAREAVEDIVDDVYNIDSGDMLGDALLNELSKDVCNASNVLNMSSTDALARSAESAATKAFYKNLSDSLVDGFTGRNGILGEATRDFENYTEFARQFFNFFNKNYTNSQEERDNYYNQAPWPEQIVMDLLSPEDDDGVNQVRGAYPKTVGITQRERILGEDGKTYSFDDTGSEIDFKFHDTFELGLIEQNYLKEISAIQGKQFNYELRVTEKIDEADLDVEMAITVPVDLKDDEYNYLSEIGYNIYDSSGEPGGIRKQIFNKFASISIPLPNKDFSQVYEKSFEVFNKNLIELLLTDTRQDDNIPMGYKFGYVTENLTSDAFVYYNKDMVGLVPYNIPEEQKKLGEFGDPRVIALNPALYGGRYSDPNYFVEPRAFTGWLELATKAFLSPSGCDPKIPPLISFDDIRERTDNLKRSLSEDPRLGDNPDCIANEPFNILLDKNTKAHLEGVVRSTIRTYITEYFFKGYGLFSNLELTANNYDPAVFLYIAQKMKQEMYGIGSPFFTTSLTIVREKYWYTFLEQAAEAYERTIDMDGIQPPPEVQDAINDIRLGMDQYVSVDAEVKKTMFERLKSTKDIISKPGPGYNPINVVSLDAAQFTLQAIAFQQTTDPEEKKDFFNGAPFEGFSGFDLFFTSLKKLKFFQKMYFIAVYEKEATLLLSELIRQEFNRLYDVVSDGITDKPHYSDLMKSTFRMMPGSTSRIGLSEYYLEKNTRLSADPGSIPNVKSNNTTSPVALSAEPQFIVEAYARLVDKADPNVSPIIRNRPQKYVGAISLSDMGDFFSQNTSLFGDNYLSDLFGNLTFLYTGSFKDLMNKGFVGDEWISRLHTLNKKEGISIDRLQDSRTRHIGSREYDDFDVIYDEAFLLPGETPEPTGTFGSTGVKYGIRLSLVFQEDFLNPADIALLRSNPSFMATSINEKSYLFDDNGFVLPLVSEEIDLVDEQFSKVHPFSGTERYDLECLINKMVERTDFKMFMEKVFGAKQASSMLSIYCMETFMPSLGAKIAPLENPPNNDYNTYERAYGSTGLPDSSWEGTMNDSGKNSLRKNFKSLYLARMPDGQSTDDDSDFTGLRGLFRTSNPFDFNLLWAGSGIKLPWWRRRKAKTKIYDANGQECVDPKKDLQ